MKLKAFLRTITGKKSKKLLKENLTPAVLYGRNIPNINLSVLSADLEKVYKDAGESAVIQLQIQKEDSSIDGRNVLINDVQYDSLSGKIIHVDFYEVRMDQKVEVAVPLVFIGEPSLVKSGEAILVKVMQEIEIEALPSDLPQEIEVDISVLDNLEKNISVGDLNLPPGVSVKSDKKNIVAALSKPEEEAAVSIEESIGKVEEVKVEAEEKKSKEEEEKENA